MLISGSKSLVPQRTNRLEYSESLSAGLEFAHGSGESRQRTKRRQHEESHILVFPSHQLARIDKKLADIRERTVRREHPYGRLTL